jgi:hypothetical protein
VLTAFLITVSGQLLLLKVIAATVVFGIAGLQVLLAARFWGVSTVPGVSAAVAARIHRTAGRVALSLAVLVAFLCLAGPAGPVSPVRVLVHTVTGAVVFGLLAAKFTILSVVRRGERWLPFVGTLLFLGFGTLWATSVADFVTAR